MMKTLTMLTTSLTTLLLTFHAVTCVTPRLAIEYSESICQRTWFERFYFEQLQSSTISSEQLRKHILMGKPAKAVLIHRNYMEAFVLDNLNMNGQVICGEALDRMSYPIGPDAQLEPIIVCTDGHVTYLNSSASQWGGNVQSTEWKVDSISFRTRDYSPEHKPVTSRYLDGSSNFEIVDNFKAMARKSEMRGVMRDRGYTFVMENTHFDEATQHLSGQSLSHISQSYTNTGSITFRDVPYHWLSSWETTGRRDSARFTMGNMERLKHTNDFVALQWYADACWTSVYVHDENGNRLQGSLDMLKMYIKMGHRVRVHFDGYTLEASAVFVSPDDVIVAQTSTEMARRRGSSSDKTFFNTKTRQVYRLVHTTGLVSSLMYFIENGELSQKANQRFTIRWSVDTRPWNPALTIDNSMNVTLGSVRDLYYAVEYASLRVKLEIAEKEARFQGKNSELYIEINHVRVPDTTAATQEVVGHSLRTVPFYRGPDNKNFLMYLYSPVKQYLEVSTSAGLTAAQFDMATHEYAGPGGMEPVSITWFNDARL